MSKEYRAPQTMQLKSITTTATTLIATTRLNFDSLIHSGQPFPNLLETHHYLMQPLNQQANLLSKKNGVAPPAHIQTSTLSPSLLFQAPLYALQSTTWSCQTSRTPSIKEHMLDSKGSRNVYRDTVHADYFYIFFRRSKFRKEKGQVDTIAYGAPVDDSLVATLLDELAQVLAWNVLKCGATRLNWLSKFFAKSFQQG